VLESASPPSSLNEHRNYCAARASRLASEADFHPGYIMLKKMIVNLIAFRHNRYSFGRLGEPPDPLGP